MSGSGPTAPIKHAEREGSGEGHAPSQGCTCWLLWSHQGAPRAASVTLPYSTHPLSVHCLGAKQGCLFCMKNARRCCCSHRGRASGVAVFCGIVSPRPGRDITMQLSGDASARVQERRENTDAKSQHPALGQRGVVQGEPRFSKGQMGRRAFKWP